MPLLWLRRLAKFHLLSSRPLFHPTPHSTTIIYLIHLPPMTIDEKRARGIPLSDIKHNQHRRANWKEYREPGVYMITFCVDGRHPLFGHLEGNALVPRTSPDFPHLVPSPLGRAIIEEELPKISRYYPQVAVWQIALMPDHIHLLLRVSETLPRGRHLGDVISSFKGGCSRALWRLQEVDNDASTRAALFEAGYHDRIIRRPGMLESIKRYMADNPLRAVMRRQLPHLLERRLHLRVGLHEYAAFGALFLLKRAEKMQVYFHRRDSLTGKPTEQTEEYQKQRAALLAEAREGVVLVSPSISNGERGVIDIAQAEGLPVIHLQKEPIGEFWKPERKRFEACVRGQYLILAPWGLDEEIKRRAAETGTAPNGAATAAGTAPNGAATRAADANGVSDYARFHMLNELAAEICATTEVTIIGISKLT